ERRDITMETELQTIALDDGAGAAPWPADVRLYQPLEAQQLLLPEHASCLAVQTYLRMCRLPYAVCSSANAEYMSPGGRLTRLPLLRVGAKLVAEFEPSVAHVEALQPQQGLDQWLDAEQREELHALVTYTENTCTLAELHRCYLQPLAYAAHAWPRSGGAHPWPLSTLRRYERRQQALRLLRVYQWRQLDDAAVHHELRQCLQQLSEKLAEQRAQQLDACYLGGRQPSQLDALIFGHVAAILKTQLPQVQLDEMVLQFPRILELCQRIDDEYYEGKQLAGKWQQGCAVGGRTEKQEEVEYAVEAVE
ncbi:hypothetical protein KR222_010428, partial [Zaprionus bogoriensis]